MRTDAGPIRKALLPDQPKIELKVAGFRLRTIVVAENGRGRDRPGVRAQERERRVVEHVERVRLKLYIHAFGDRKSLSEGLIEPMCSSFRRT